MSCQGIPACCDELRQDAAVELWHTADSGVNDSHQAEVKALLIQENAQALVLGGDNDYLIPHDYASSVGAYYQSWIDRGTLYPILGNHDMDLDGGVAYNAYFFPITSGITHYVKRLGPVDCFFINSGYNTAMVQTEPDGNTADSNQAQQLAEWAAESTAAWKVVFLHHPPYSSDNAHGQTAALQWDFAGMGIDLVVAGHGHVYERLLRDDGVTYIVNGLGGGARYGFVDPPLDGSQVRYSDEHGALRLRFSLHSCEILFKEVHGVIVDATELTK